MNETPASPNYEALQAYRCSKLVKAGKIVAIRAGDSLSDDHVLSVEIPVPGSKDQVTTAAFPVAAAWIERHKPEVGGYFVHYQDSYSSYSPAPPFEDGYRAISGLRYGEAIEAMRRGCKLRRRRWLQGAFVILVPATCSIEPRPNTPYWRALQSAPNGVEPVSINSHFDFYAPAGHFQPGWAPSAHDQLASDWEIIP